METQNLTIQLPARNTQSPFSTMRGAHVAVRVPDYEASKQWYLEKLDFRLIHEWPFGDLQLAYLAPANDDNFWVELLAGGQLYVVNRKWTDAAGPFFPLPGTLSRFGGPIHR
jgi:catechol 2,3-dioxygenase-like lactoylglutathione lyase family enzyme